MLSKLLSNVDVLAGLGGLAWAIAALYLPELASLCDPRVAFSFFLAAEARGLLALKEG